MLLAGDIGGTKTVLAIIGTQAGARQPVARQTYPSGKYGSLEAIIAAFLKENAGANITHGSFGVAGPVFKGSAHITNLSWVIDAGKICQSFGLTDVHLLNDLESIATAVPYLQSDDVATLHPGIPDKEGAMAIVAPGTGLGEAFSVWDGRSYQPHPTEGGHTSFAPTTQEQQALLTYLWGKYNRVSYERVCSGIGIPNIYNFLRDTKRFPEPAWLRDELAQAPDPTPIIFNAALEKETPICQAVVRLFVEILADEASNMALKVLATGGVYLGGGMPPRILPQLQEYGFMAHFSQKGRFSELLRQMPVHVICNTEVALFGAAYHALTMVNA